ncbi:hypothetical protein [Polycladidibacter stylochi]|uniref:hypothetical protein n=1 Tax=Polycladidibacter stylochi TaxID=1807766 RepID=UPI00082E7032|nr:hypothetical protein [Pseudovibrio stylochi]
MAGARGTGARSGRVVGNKRGGAPEDSASVPNNQGQGSQLASTANSAAEKLEALRASLPAYEKALAEVASQKAQVQKDSQKVRDEAKQVISNIEEVAQKVLQNVEGEVATLRNMMQSSEALNSADSSPPKAAVSPDLNALPGLSELNKTADSAVAQALGQGGPATQVAVAKMLAETISNMIRNEVQSHVKDVLDQEIHPVLDNIKKFLTSKMGGVE